MFVVPAASNTILNVPNALTAARFDPAASAVVAVDGPALVLVADPAAGAAPAG